MANTERIVDCHAHIIDPQRFPFTGHKGYQPRISEKGTREAFCAVLDEHGVSNGVLVQLSGYGTDNSANLDAMKSYPGRFKAIAVVDPDATDRTLEELADAGVVGVRFNLPSYDPCIWGSDWPFINVPRRPVYAHLLSPLSRWLPDPGDRARVLAHNPRRLFGFGDYL